MDSPRSDIEQMDQEEKEWLQIVGDYKHGSIKRVKLINFLTYTEVEFSPKPRLNMVVGPNGTGKSSILCAICLGLGGEPRLLGRATELETFIQTGETEAFIELELANERGKDPVITRTIRNDGKNKSSFTWDGEVVSGKKVRERVAEEFQIQIDNLCTFLPQEKVGNFSGFDSKSLLLETEKTLSKNKNLYTTHLELIEMQEDLHGGDDQVEGLTQKVDQLEVELKRMEREVQRMEQLRLIEEQAELLKKKILWLKVDTMREECMLMKGEKDEKKKALEDVQELSAPLIEAHEEAKRKLANIKREFEKSEKRIKDHKTQMDRHKQKYEKHDDEIEEVLSAINTIENSRAELERRAQETRDRVAILQEQVDKMPSMDQLDADYHEAREVQKASLPAYNEKKRELDDLHRHEALIKEELGNVERKWHQLNDEKANRRRHVFQRASEVKAAYEWIQQNRTVFRKEVIGPIACEVTPKSNNSAAYLEQHVPNAVLKSFIVQDKSDYDLLYKKVRVEMSIPINIITIDRIEPPKPRMYSDEILTILKRDHGVIGYLDESLDAPEVVVEALKSSASIDKVLVGNERTQGSMDNKNLAGFLSQPLNEGGRLRGYCIFTSQGGRSFKYTSQISNYSGKPSLRVDEIRAAQWLTRGSSEEAKLSVERDLKEKRRQIEEIVPRLERTKGELEQVRLTSQEAQARLKDAHAFRVDAQKIINKLNASQRKLEAMEEELAKDDAEEKRTKVDQLNQRIHHSLKALKAHSDSYKLMLKATIETSGARLQVEAATIEERHCKDKLDESREKLEKAERDFRQVKARFSQMKEEYRALQDRAKTEAPLEDDNGETPLKEKLQVDLAQYETVDHAEAALEEAEQKIRNTVADRNVARLYEAKQQELEVARDQLENLKKGKQTKMAAMSNKAEPWEEALHKFMGKIDSRFSRYMSDLGCVGEVRLRKGKPGAEKDEEEPRFEDYGVEIKVSFREGVKPTVLSARVQSGGERSVSTIMYLMALQDMMVSPFRCVDEINQGLDERNERLVFKRIVENSTKPPGSKGPTDHCGQYWLITPKLLPNLTDMEVEAMNVVCIFNGPYNLKRPTDWDVKRLVAMRKRRRLDDDGGDENE
ncbi:chromosome segretation protein [Nitzschia inconspicua]|uniref:Chromosome segretation protein n=1 Tax=Nitzschia inconspicua TaxID=303405 RepID=A0A9K3Q810_9STRA|nr:chromosome segretation protein [Nitzschia inconspicua]